MVEDVLILVLVDVGLGHHGGVRRRMAGLHVLILVLVDVGLGLQHNLIIQPLYQES